MSAADASGKPTPRRLVGFHAPEGTGGWGSDLAGYLLGEFADGWWIVANHISSGPGWASIDIKRHADKYEGVPYEWVGELSGSECRERYPASTDPDGPT